MRAQIADSAFTIDEQVVEARLMLGLTRRREHTAGAGQQGDLGSRSCSSGLLSGLHPGHPLKLNLLRTQMLTLNYSFKAAAEIE